MEERNEPTLQQSLSWRTLSPSAHPPLALILSDGEAVGPRALISRRCKAALPFAGKYRLIDFALSSCVNAGIEQVGVIAQYQPRSLQTHLGDGRPWDLDRATGGLTYLNPYQTRAGMNWYNGTADAIHKNRAFILRQRSDEVLVLPGDHVYQLDVSVLTALHVGTRADMTLTVAASDEENVRLHHTVVTDDEGRVRTHLPPEAEHPGPWTVMGAMLFSTDVLVGRASEDAADAHSAHDLVADLLPRLLEAGDRVMAFQYTGYWNPVRSVVDYWQSHMGLVSDAPALNLQDEAWFVHTRSDARPPTHVSARAKISHSLISDGCIIEGTVEDSVLSPGVCVGAGAVVRNSVVMHNSIVEERARVENAVLDMDVVVGAHAQVGQLRRQSPTLAAVSPNPLTVVTGGIHVPAATQVVVDERINDRLARAYAEHISHPRPDVVQ
jgi:glucose-1-phosphate adenylyltransferase